MEQNENVIRYVFEEFFKKGNFSQYDQIASEDICIHCPESWSKIHNTLITNRTEARTIDIEYAKAFQWIDVEIGDLVITNQNAFVRWNANGIHVEDFFHLFATKHRISLSGHTLYHFNNEGRIDTVWQSWDMLGLLEQISSLPIKSMINLSDREKDCLRYLIEGKTAKETAISLGLSYRTIEYYFENLKRKLNCITKRELIQIAHLFEKQNLL